MKPPHADALQEHAGFIRALARGLLSDPDQADDIVQETCLAALRHPPRHRANLRAWLGTVARNLAFRRHRSARRRAHHEARAVRPDRLPSPAELAERMELQRKVLNAVDSLEEPFRASLIFRYFDDLTPSEIAGHLQIPVKTVKSRLNRALSKLRARLDYDHGGDRTAWSALLLPMVLPTAHAGAATAGGALATGGVVITMKKAVVLFVVVFLGAGLVVWQAVATHEDPSTPRSRAERQEPGSQAGGNATTKTGTGARAETPLPILGRGDEIPAFTFAGRVVDSQGRGVGGAEVRLFYWAATADDHAHYSAKILRREYERHEGPSARTGPDGHFRFDRPYRSRSYLRAHAKGFFPAVTEVHEPGEFILITLGGEESLRVRVVDVRARPVAEATVRLVTASGRSMTRHVLAEEKTDTAGLARLPRPGDGGLRLEVDPKDPDLGFVEHLVDPTRDEVEISVPSVETLVRRIVDVDTGAPVPDAYVMIMRPGGSGFPTERRRFLVDAKGLVRIPPTGAPPARATAPGYEVAHVGLAEEVRISQAMLVEGVVLDKRGHPVSDVPVLVAVPPGGVFVRVFSGLPVVAAWSNEQGRFDLYIKAPAGAYDAGVRSLIGLHAEYAPAVVDSIRVLPGRFKQVELRFPESATLEVEVVGTGGNPLPRQWVTVRRTIPGGSTELRPVRGHGVDLVAFRPPHSLVTDSHGRVEVSHLPPGHYEVRSENTTADCSLAEGERASLRIVKGTRAGISGRVVDAAGKPVARIVVGVHGPTSGYMETDSGGTFRFDDLPPGRHWVGVSVRGAEGFYTYQVPAHPGQDVLLQLPAGPAKLRIHVQGPAEGSAQYSLRTVTGGRVPWRSGWSALLKPLLQTPGFTPGQGILVVRAKGHGWAAVLFDAAAQRTTDVSVQLPSAGSVAGRVAEPARNQQQRVHLVRQDDVAETWTGDVAALWQGMRRRVGGELSVTIAADGTFRFDDVPPGSYRATHGSSQESASARLEVLSGKTTTITIP